MVCYVSVVVILILRLLWGLLLYWLMCCCVLCFADCAGGCWLLYLVSGLVISFVCMLLLGWDGFACCWIFGCYAVFV